MTKVLFKIFIIITLFFLSGCYNKKDNFILKVGISSWPGYEPLALALDKNLYKDVNIKIIRFATPTDAYRALRDGIIDVSAFTADEVFPYAQAHRKPRIFLVLDISNGGDAIVAHSKIKNIDELSGKKIGLEDTTLAHYMLERSIDFSTNLKTTDLKLIPMEMSQQLNNFKESKIDAAITYEPTKSLLLNAGGHVLFDSTQIPNEIVDILVTNEETILKKKEALKQLTKGWFRAIKYIDKNHEQAMSKMAKYEGISTKDFTDAYNQLIIPSKSENIKMLSDAKTLIAPMKKLSKLLYEQGSIKAQIDVKLILDGSIIKELED